MRLKLTPKQKKIGLVLAGVGALLLLSGSASAQVTPSGQPIPPPDPNKGGGSGGVPPFVPGVKDEGVMAIVNTQDSGASGVLRIHETPEISGNVVGTVAHGGAVRVDGPAVTGDGTQSTGWTPITSFIDKISGYVSNDFLRPA